MAEVMGSRTREVGAKEGKWQNEKKELAKTFVMLHYGL